MPLRDGAETLSDVVRQEARETWEQKMRRLAHQENELKARRAMLSPTSKAWQDANTELRAIMYEIDWHIERVDEC